MSSFVRVLVVVVLVLGFMPGVVMLDAVRQGASGQPSCTDPGRALPVVVVHGFRSDGAAMSDLVAMLEDTAIDVAVETFDYGEDSTWWVTHEQIGPRLRQRLICLADASLAAGGLGRVVVVGHSMGGLATRHALSTDDGDGRGVLVDEIALVATIGTPHQGSVWGVPASHLERTLQTSLTTRMWGQPLPLAGTPAGGALAVGSSQLERLPDFPAGVPVLALASEYVGQSGFLFYRSPEVRIGDAVVSRSSALALSRELDGIGGTEDITCRLELPLELGPASISAAVSAELVANPAVKDCGHLWQHQAHRLTGEINTHIAVAANQPPRTVVQAPPAQSPAFEVAFVEAYVAGGDISWMTASGDDAGMGDLFEPDPSGSFSVHSFPMLDPPQAPPGAACALEGDVTSFCFVSVVRNGDEGRPAAPVYLQVYSSRVGTEYRGDGVVDVPDGAPLVIEFVSENQYRPMTLPFDIAAAFVRSVAQGVVYASAMHDHEAIDQARGTELWESVDRYSFVEVGLGRTGPLHRWGEPAGSACEMIGGRTPLTRCVVTAYQDGRKLATVAVDVEAPHASEGPLRVVGVQDLSVAPSAEAGPCADGSGPPERICVPGLTVGLRPTAGDPPTGYAVEYWSEELGWNHATGITFAEGAVDRMLMAHGVTTSIEDSQRLCAAMAAALTEVELECSSATPGPPTLPRAADVAREFADALNRGDVAHAETFVTADGLRDARGLEFYVDTAPHEFDECFVVGSGNISCNFTARNFSMSIVFELESDRIQLVSGSADGL